MTPLSDLIASLKTLPQRVPDFASPVRLQATARHLETTALKPKLDVDKMKALIGRFRALLELGEESLDELKEREVKRLAWILNYGETALADTDELLPALRLFDRRMRPPVLLGLITCLLKAPDYIPASNVDPWLATIKRALSQYDGPIEDLRHWKGLTDLLFSLDSPRRIGKWALEQEESIAKSLDSLKIGRNTILFKRSLDGIMRAVAESPAFPAKVMEVVETADSVNMEVFKKAVDLVLSRYADSPSLPPDEPLIALCMKKLGDPRLRRTASWGDVSGKARKQAERWVSKQDLELFFRAVAMDEDRRRFWLAYVEQIDLSLNVLGSDALISSDPAIKDYLKQTDRYARLDASDGASAFVMGFRNVDLLVVEFSNTGDACYIYRREGNFIPLHQRWLKRGDLKVQTKAIHRIIHRRHGNHATWMPDARAYLGSHGLVPDRVI